MAKKITSYHGCGIILNIILVKNTLKNGRVRLWSLASTKDYTNPAGADSLSSLIISGVISELIIKKN